VVPPPPGASPADRPAAGHPSRHEAVVHVTIGRVEVRAEIAPDTPSAAPRERRVLPLEEYLARRAEGRS
jgi:hypothetical protein